MIHTRLAVIVSFVLALNGCALLSKGDVPMRRYYSPDLAGFGPPAAAIPRPGAELRLGRITSNAFLGERIMYRESAHEVGFYDDRIWTEKPEAYLRRSLNRVLFEEQGLRSVVRGGGPTLEVELVSFEEVREPHVARVRVTFSLSDERVVALQQTITVDRPVAKKETDSVAEAMSLALRDAVYEISGRVVTDLARAPSASAPCPVATAR